MNHMGNQKRNTRKNLKSQLKFRAFAITFTILAGIAALVLGIGTSDASAASDVYISKISVNPTEFTLYQNVDGTYEEADNGSSYFHYAPVFNDGDELTLTYSDDSESSYYYNYEQAVFASFDGSTIREEDLEFVSDQGTVSSGKVTEWGIGTHTGEIKYQDATCEVTIDVEENPVSSISFNPSTFEIYVNSEGWWETKSFYYYYPEFSDGDTLTVKYTDGNSVKFTFYKEDDAFVSEDGDEIMSRDIKFVSEQDDLLADGKSCWGAGTHTGHFEYMNKKSSDITINIKKSSVNKLTYTPVNTYEVIEETGSYGMWLKDSSGDDYFHYFYPTAEEGDKIAITDSDGSTKTYVGESYITDSDREIVKFVNQDDSSDYISSDSVFFCDDQSTTHWIVGTKNKYWVEYQGVKSDSINATVLAKGTTPSGRNAVRIAGSTRYETSLKIADAMKSSKNAKFDAVILADGRNYPDALAGSFLATGLEVPIILVDDNHLNEIAEYVENNLSSGGTVYILGGTGAVSNAVENRFKSTFKIVRLGGNTRYETNLKILEEGTQDSDLSGYTVIVCSGTGYADSLSASSTGQPILIVNPSTGITDEQMDFLRKSGANDFIIAGGKSSVPTKVETKLKTIGSVERIGGSSRYETSAMIAKYFVSDGTPNAVIAYGGNFPDGLCAGPLAWVKDANLILCSDSSTDYSQSYMDTYGIVKGYITGGTGVISDNSVKNIFRVDSITEY